MFQEQVYRQNERICPICQRENRADDVRCMYCDSELESIITVIVPDKIVGQSRPEQLNELLKHRRDTLLLYVTGPDQPILLKGSGTIILGRRSDQQDTSPVFDLTPYGASSLGVSRHHAVIRFKNRDYTIEDLGSTNGTKVNEEKLIPHVQRQLHNGDMIQLGHLILFAYYVSFSDQDQSATRSTIALVSMREAPGSAFYTSLNPARLERYILPYMAAVIEFQSLLDVMLGNSASAGIHIQSISVGSDSAHIAVQITGGQPTINFLRETVMPWRMKRGGVTRPSPDTCAIDQFFGDIDDPVTLPDKESEATSEPQPDANDAETLEAIRQLASQLVFSMSPTLDTQELARHLEKLIEPLRLLCLGTLEIVEVSA